MKSNAPYAAAYRARQSEKLKALLEGSIKLEVRTKALESIAAKLDGRTGALSVEVRAMVLEALR